MATGMVGLHNGQYANGGYPPPLSGNGQAIQSYREANTLLLQKIINQKLQQMSTTPSNMPFPPGKEYQEIARAINYMA
jgi:hypothetical protein